MVPTLYQLCFVIVAEQYPARIRSTLPHDIKMAMRKYRQDQRDFPRIHEEWRETFTRRVLKNTLPRCIWSTTMHMGGDNISSRTLFRGLDFSRLAPPGIIACECYVMALTAEVYYRDKKGIRKPINTKFYRYVEVFPDDEDDG